MNTRLGFAITQLFPTAIAQSFPVTVTIPDHGLSVGNTVRATNFFYTPPSAVTGMYQLNNRIFMIGNVTTNTFDLFTLEGEPIDGTNYTAFVNNGLAQFNLTGQDLFTQNLNQMVIP